MEKCLVILSFGMGKGADNYGDSNEALAKIAAETGLPIIAQWEIARILEKKYNVPTILSVEKIGNKYLDTFDVLKEAKVLMNVNGFTNAVFIGHQIHLPRILLSAHKMGFEVEPKESFDLVMNQKIPYDKKSTQWWTRSELRFVAREIIYTSYLTLAGKI